MKTLIMIVMLSGTIMTAQKKETIPTAVKDAFVKEYPNTKAKWEKEGDLYEAEFTLKGKEASANYDQSGKLKEVETEIKTSELPANSVAYVNKNFPASKITEATKITDDKNTITYEAEVKKGGKSQDVLFDANGNFLKVNQKQEKEKKED